MWLAHLVHRFYLSLFQEWHFDIFSAVKEHLRVLSDLRNYASMNPNQDEVLSKDYLLFMTRDKTMDNPLEPIYFFQNAWAAKQIFSYKPKKHIDVGSAVTAMGIISQFVPTTYIDIRKISVQLNGLQYKKGNILSLPFHSNSVESLSSICVIEHIGLGRYGDVLDTLGTIKAAQELQRVLKKNGHLLITVPVDSANKVYFNAHRAFTRSYILKLFSSLKIVEETYLYGSKLYNRYSASKGFGTGFFHFKK